MEDLIHTIQEHVDLKNSTWIDEAEKRYVGSESMTDERKSALHPGHLKALERLEDTPAYRHTLALYREALGGIDVYLRPTGKGFTVLSLDGEAASMIGVGARGTSQHTITKLSPDAERIKIAVDGYWQKRATLKRPSLEELYSVELIRSSYNTGLSLERNNIYFINQEWMLPSGARIDLLCVNPGSGRLVVVELKSDEAAARKSDAGKGGDAWQQSANYADELFSHRAKLYSYFQRLAHAMGRGHVAPAELLDLVLDESAKPETYVSWPGVGFLSSR